MTTNCFSNRGVALARAADAMLRALGGHEVVLRFAVPLAGNETARELGAEQPGVEDISISPAIVRADGKAFGLLTSASTRPGQLSCARPPRRRNCCNRR